MQTRAAQSAGECNTATSGPPAPTRRSHPKRVAGAPEPPHSSNAEAPKPATLEMGGSVHERTETKKPPPTRSRSSHPGTDDRASI